MPFEEALLKYCLGHPRASPRDCSSRPQWWQRMLPRNHFHRPVQLVSCRLPSFKNLNDLRRLPKPFDNVSGPSLAQASVDGYRVAPPILRTVRPSVISRCIARGRKGLRVCVRSVTPSDRKIVDAKSAHAAISENVACFVSSQANSANLNKHERTTIPRRIPKHSG
jgi:hypothetical protein